MSLSSSFTLAALATGGFGILASCAARSWKLRLRLASRRSVACVALALISGLVFGLRGGSLTAILLISGLCVSALTDLETGLVFDRVTAACILSIFVATACTGTTGSALAGGVLVGLPLAGLWLWTRGAGIGGGDVKLGFAIGSALGAQTGLVALGIAFVAGAIVACILLAGGRVQRRSRLPFVPYLAAGSAAATLLSSR